MVRCSANYLFYCCQESKFKHVHNINIQWLFQNFSCRTHHNFARKQILPCRTHQNSNGSLEIRKIGLKFHKFSFRTDYCVLNMLKIVYYMQNYSLQNIQKLPGAKHCENTCFVYIARWLLSPYV